MSTDNQETNTLMISDEKVATIITIVKKAIIELLTTTQLDINTNISDNKLSISVDEAAKMIDVGKAIMLDLVKKDGFPAVRFDRKIIINKKQFIQWFDDLTSGKIII